MSSNKKVLGFIPPIEPQSSMEEVPCTACQNEAMLTYDSGKSITFADASLHTLAVGGTGCGKTTTMTVPALKKMIEKGFPGYIVDIKGNLINIVRAIAKRCGREDAIVELGSECTAERINRLQNLKEFEAGEFFESLLSGFTTSSDHNIHFHKIGVFFARDAYKLLSIIAVKDKSYTPTLVHIRNFLANTTEATKFFIEFEKYKDDFACEAYPLPEIDAFINCVKNNAFHIFTSPALKEMVAKSTINTYNEQINYTTRTLLMSLKEILETPGIVRNFCHVDPQQKPFDMEKAIYDENKIIISRFSPVSGETGAKLSRNLATQVYKAVFKRGLKMPKGKYVFVCYDEFQTFKDLSSYRYSDAGYIDKSREFNGIFIAATQSLSALMDDYTEASLVDKFVSNCNNRTIYYTDDPYTQRMVHRYDEDVQLNAMDGKVFVITYDSKSRKHTYGLEGVQNSHESVKELIEQNPYNAEINMDVEKSISKIPELMENIKHVASMQLASMENLDDMTQEEANTYEIKPLPFTGHLGTSVFTPPTFIITQQ